MQILADKQLDDEDSFLQFIEHHEPFNCYHCVNSPGFESHSTS